MQKFNFSYDRESDDLFLFKPGAKSQGSVELGDLVMDFNNKKELVGLQILGASKMMKDLCTEKVSVIRNILNNIKNCKVDIKDKGNLLIVKIYLISQSEELAPVLSIPAIRESSPALASA